MEANRIELDPSGQVLEGRTIAGEISSVNHRTPCPSAPPIEGRVKSNDQKRQSKRDTDKRYNENRKQKEDEIIKEVESLEKISGELESEHKELQRQEKQWQVNVDKEYGKIVSQLEDNNAGQNTDVQGASAHADFPIANADINTTGEISMGHDGHKREMNQAPITSNAGTFSRENASMNVQLVGSSGLTDKRVKKRIADKKCREKRKGKINEAQERIRELRIKNHKLQLQNVKSKAKATQLQKQLAQYRNISALMTSKNARRNALLEQVLSDHLLQNSGHGSTPFNTQLQNSYQGNTPFNAQLQNTGQGSTSFNPQLQLLLKLIGFGTRETMLHVHQPPVYQSGTTMGSRGPAIEESLGLPQSHLLQGRTHLPSGMTPNNTFSTGEAGLPVHHPSDYQYVTTMGSGGQSNGVASITCLPRMGTWEPVPGV